jgi:hypothetical protein
LEEEKERGKLTFGEVREGSLLEKCGRFTVQEVHDVTPSLLRLGATARSTKERLFLYGSSRADQRSLGAA